MSNSLLDMPPEVQRAIVELVNDSKSFRRIGRGGTFRTVDTIWDLKFCCHGLRPIAQDVFYSTTQIKLHNVTQILQFIRTMFDQPYLAEKVKELNVTCGSWEHPRAPHPRTPSRVYDDKMRDKAAYVINSFSQDKVLNKHWINNHLPKERFDSVMALAMLVLRGLQKLTLKINCQDSSDHRFFEQNQQAFSYLHRVLQEAWRRENSRDMQNKLKSLVFQIDEPSKITDIDYSGLILQSLVKVHVGLFTNGLSKHSMHHLAAFCQLKSIKSLVVTWISPKGLEKVGPSSFGTVIKDLQSLDLQIPAPINTKFFQEFISCFSSLQTFSLWVLAQCRNGKVQRAGSHPMNGIVRCISHLKSSLRKLTLAPSCQANYETPRERHAIATETDYIESLAGFKQLTDIDVVAFDLWIYRRESPFSSHSAWAASDRPKPRPLVEILPPSIKVLRLQESGPHTLLHVRDFLEGGFERTPDLSVIDIIMKDGSELAPELSAIDIVMRDSIEIGLLEKLALRCCIRLAVMTRTQAGLTRLTTMV